jgi:glutathione synthase/RimK-type ligase-like ATP-grasp enzyme
VERLGLCYGAIDMVLTPDGRYVFLEINPNGQYLWIEEAAGLPISDAICDLLMSGSQMKRAAA